MCRRRDVSNVGAPNTSVSAPVAGKLRDEHCAIDVSVTAAAAIDTARTENHDHAVEIEVSIESKIAGNDQSSLPRRIAWSKREIAIHKSENAIRITWRQDRQCWRWPLLHVVKYRPWLMAAFFIPSVPYKNSLALDTD